MILVDPNCLMPARLEFLRAEFQQKLNLPRGTQQEFQAQVTAKWQDREVPRLLEHLFARMAPGARLPRCKEDRADTQVVQAAVHGGQMGVYCIHTNHDGAHHHCIACCDSTSSEDKAGGRVIGGTGWQCECLTVGKSDDAARTECFKGFECSLSPAEAPPDAPPCDNPRCTEDGTVMCQKQGCVGTWCSGCAQPCASGGCVRSFCPHCADPTAHRCSGEQDEAVPQPQIQAERDQGGWTGGSSP